MKPYIDFNTARRTIATTNFEKDFFKLMNNASYGKTMENLRNRIQFELINNEKKFLRVNAKPNAKKPIHFNENLVGIELTKPNIKLDKPIYTGPCVLDLSKLLMARYHYDYIKREYGDRATLLFTDTDSLAYEIRADDIFEDRLKSPELFDMSDYDPSHKCFSINNKKVIGKFKDEAIGKQITEFIGLRPKMYSMLIDGKEKKRAKGVKRAVVAKIITHADYLKILETSDKNYCNQRIIRSKQHQLYTMDMNKVGLSAYDNKRYLVDKINSLAYGHYKIPTLLREQNLDNLIKLLAN
jgi:hypothetical protein